MSTKIFQSMLQQIGADIERKLGIIDEKGQIVACNADADELSVDFSAIVEYDTAGGTLEGYTYKIIDTKAQTDFYAFCEGEDETARGYNTLISAHFANMRLYYDDKYDKTNFVKNLITDNILPGDVVPRARDLHLTSDVRRAVFLIKVKDAADGGVSDVLANMFPDGNRDFVVNIAHREIVLVKEMRKNATDKDFYKIAQSISDTVNSEGMTSANIGISSAVDTIQDLARAYREARVAIDVGKVFGNEKNIVSYNNLGIGRLIYQLPITLCELFLKEVFEKEPIEVLDKDTLVTIQKFFENSLNVSETSRKLFVHRNTLVYRLDKIEKLTGLDLREFDDAIVFKVAMMVSKYLKSQQ